MSKLEQHLRDLMLSAAETASREFKYQMPYLRRMIEAYGAVETARRLLHEPITSDGFATLWEAQQLDLSVESIVLRPEFAELFTEAELAIARNRLNGAGVRACVQ